MNKMGTGCKGKLEVTCRIFSWRETELLLGYRYLGKFIIATFSHLGEHSYGKEKE